MEAQKYALHLQCIFVILNRVILLAEFCLDCWNKMTNTDDPPKKYVMSDELDLCEECGQWKRVIVTVRKRYILKERFCEWMTDLSEK